jgi:PAS domain S-box-containing protein
MDSYYTNSSAYARSLIEASLDPLFTINTSGKITDINSAAIKVTNVPREKLKGSDFFKYFTDPIKAKQVYEEIFKVGFVIDYPLTIRDGKLTDVLFNGSLFKDENNIVMGAVVVARDVTAQKILSKYSLSLIEASHDPLVTINNEGKITDMNEATVNITGVTRINLKGTDFFNYFTDPQKAREVYLEVFANGSVADSPLTLKHKNGNLTDVLFNGSVYKDDQGKVLGVVIVARDVTYQKVIASELVEARIFAELATGLAEVARHKAESATKIAEDSVKSKQQFLSNMSHEIRTPMNAIIGFTKVLLKTELSPKQREYLSAIKMSGDSLIVLINDILDLAKVDAGKMQFEETPFKMANSIAAMLHLFDAKIQEKNIEFLLNYDQKIPEILMGDSVRLHQIILNLISNAVKFTNQGSITVSVKLVDETADDVQVEFSVTDTGIGIQENRIKEIFENFQQASSNTARLYGGTGLGLAIVKQLVEGQQGSIDVKSEMGKGSTFSFQLKFNKAKGQYLAEVEIPVQDQIIKTLNVLVVEDIALNQLLMKTLLEDFEFGCDIASNGKVAIEKLKKHSYDIILMDLQMPEMNGFDATAFIRNEMKMTIPIVALTADVTTVDLAKCKSVGMNDYIAKPVDEKLLFTKIVILVKKYHAEQLNIALPKNNLKHFKYIDLDYLYQRTKSNNLLLIEMITLYLEQTPSLIEAMKKGLETEDWQMLQAAAHKIIPSFSIMGISADFENIAKKVQEHAINQQQKIEIVSLVQELESALNGACIELSQELALIKSTKNG